MEVERSALTEAQSRKAAQRKRDAEHEQQRLQMEQAKTLQERKAALETQQENHEKELVEISKQASNQIASMKKLNSDRLHSLNENQQKNFETLAQKTAEDIKRIDEDALRTIQTHKAGVMEKIRTVTDRSEDPFYRLKGLDPELTENDTEYTVKLKLPEHEARNLFISGEGPFLKLSLSRRHQDSLQSPDGNRNTKTSSFQSVVEQVAIPGAYDSKKISHEFKNGIVTVRVPKPVIKEDGKT